MRSPGDIIDIRMKALEFRARLNKIKREAGMDEFWYPYDILANFNHLAMLLEKEHRDFFSRIDQATVVDIGAADGDNSFFLESLGAQVDLVDNAPTNWNGLEGARRLKAGLKSSVAIHAIDLDSQFEFPRARYDIAFFLGILYHLKNPYYALERLAAVAKYCLVSTKIARYAGSNGVEIKSLPLAYLLMKSESNNDPTNYWVFSETGLRRLFDRTGWVVEAFASVGDTAASDPVHADHDERAFCLLRSNK